jgi:hypothetical protein
LFNGAADLLLHRLIINGGLTPLSRHALRTTVFKRLFIHPVSWHHVFQVHLQCFARARGVQPVVAGRVQQHHASRFSITLSDFQRKKLKNRAAELHGADKAAKRAEQSEFADMLKAMVEMMRTAPDGNLKPATTWK